MAFKTRTFKKKMSMFVAAVVVLALIGYAFITLGCNTVRLAASAVWGA